MAWGDQPVRSEQVTVQIQLSLGDAVDLGDHPRPVHLDQGTDERTKPDQFIARPCASLRRAQSSSSAISSASL